MKIWSGRRDSNPRPQPWQGCALPLSYARIHFNAPRSDALLTASGDFTQSRRGRKRGQINRCLPTCPLALAGRTSIFRLTHGRHQWILTRADGGRHSPRANLSRTARQPAFMADVIDASHDAPVIVDFWAPWCGPCKQLGAGAGKGRARRARARSVWSRSISTKTRNLAQQMRIQSIPAVYAFKDGRPVDGFVGALPDSQVKQFVTKPAARATGRRPRRSEAVALAKEAFAAGDPPRAANVFAQWSQHDPGNARSRCRRSRAGSAPSAQDNDLTTGARDLWPRFPADRGQARRGDCGAHRLELAEAGSKPTGAVRRALEGQAGDPRSRGSLRRGSISPRRLFAAGEREAAIDQLLTSSGATANGTSKRHASSSSNSSRRSGRPIR